MPEWKKISKGIHEDGISCLVINSDVQESDKVTGEKIPAQFEVSREYFLLFKSGVNMLSQTGNGKEICCSCHGNFSKNTEYKQIMRRMNI